MIENLCNALIKVTTTVGKQNLKVNGPLVLRFFSSIPVSSVGSSPSRKNNVQLTYDKALNVVEQQHYDASHKVPLVICLARKTNN